MDCNREEATRAKSIAERMLEQKDFFGAKKFVLKAQALYPGLDGISHLLRTLDVYISAENKIGGETDWYGVLGVDPNADEETIKKKYRKLALIVHPDKNKSVGADGAFQLILEAWTLLSDKASRLAYNERRGIEAEVPIHTGGGPPMHVNDPQTHCFFPFAPSSFAPFVPTGLGPYVWPEQTTGFGPSDHTAGFGPSFPSDQTTTGGFGQFFPEQPGFGSYVPRPQTGGFAPFVPSEQTGGFGPFFPSEETSSTAGFGRFFPEQPGFGTAAPTGGPSAPSEQTTTTGFGRFFPTGGPTRMPSASTPTPTQQTSSTFWTICQVCKKKYEYLRIYVNCSLCCYVCHTPFPSVRESSEHGPRQGKKKSTDQNVSSGPRRNDSTTAQTSGAGQSSNMPGSVDVVHIPVKRRRNGR